MARRYRDGKSSDSRVAKQIQGRSGGGTHRRSYDVEAVWCLPDSCWYLSPSDGRNLVNGQVRIDRGKNQKHLCFFSARSRADFGWAVVSAVCGSRAAAHGRRGSCPTVEGRRIDKDRSGGLGCELVRLLKTKHGSVSLHCDPVQTAISGDGGLEPCRAARVPHVTNSSFEFSCRA